jgi:hypothetical protein
MVKMFFSRILSWSILSLYLVAAAPGPKLSALPTDQPVPPGFQLQLSSVGVELYRKDYSGGNPDFVQVIDLSQGAIVKPLYGNIRDPRPGRGIYGGGDPRIQYESLGQFWNEFKSDHPNAFCVSNGQFFYMLENPTRLPFSLKVDGVVVTDGYDSKSYPGERLMLELWEGYADIAPLTGTALYASTAPDIIAGLTEEANKRAKYYVGRTFVGIEDRNQDGSFETILIYTTKTARQVDAAEVLRSFGAQKVMMLDGGGSTQLICQNTTLVESERLIPQALAVAAGPEVVPTPTPAPVIPQLEKVDHTELQKGPGISAETAMVIPTLPLENAVGLKTDQSVKPAIVPITLGDVIWIPLVMSPFALVLVVVIRTIRPVS